MNRFDDMTDEEYFDMMAKFLSPNVYEFLVQVDTVCPNCMEPVVYEEKVEHDVRVHRKHVGGGGYVEIYRPKSVPGGLCVPFDIECPECGRTWREQVPGFPVAKIEYEEEE